MASGSKAGSLDAHHLVNRTDRDMVHRDRRSRRPRQVVYSDDDIRAAFADDRWRFVHKDWAAQSQRRTLTGADAS